MKRTDSFRLADPEAIGPHSRRRRQASGRGCRRRAPIRLRHARQTAARPSPGPQVGRRPPAGLRPPCPPVSVACSPVR